MSTEKQRKGREKLAIQLSAARTCFVNELGPSSYILSEMQKNRRFGPFSSEATDRILIISFR